VLRNPRLVVAIAGILLALIALEGLSRLLVWRGSRAHRAYRVTAMPTFWADLNRYFGVWHRPHARFRHAEACWDVTYQANSYGARHVERPTRSSAHRRHVVLGDSFIEGYAIPDGERLTAKYGHYTEMKTALVVPDLNRARVDRPVAAHGPTRRDVGAGLQMFTVSSGELC
jgi:hypothetical protein